MSPFDVLSALGLVMVGGVFVQWATDTRALRRERRTALVALAGLTVMAIGTTAALLRPLAGGEASLVESLASPPGVAAILRLAVVCGVAGFFTDLSRGTPDGWRATVTLSALGISALTLSVPTGLRVGVTVVAASVVAGVLGTVVLRRSRRPAVAPRPAAVTAEPELASEPKPGLAPELKPDPRPEAKPRSKPRKAAPAASASSTRGRLASAPSSPDPTQERQTISR